MMRSTSSALPAWLGRWLAGCLLLALLAGGALLWRGRRPAPDAAPLTDQEEARLGELLKGERLRRDPDATSPHDGR